MRAYVLAAVCVSLVLVPKARAMEGDHDRASAPFWQPCVWQSSREFRIPVNWIDAVIMAESGGHTHLKGRPITSSAGAMGLMQLMPRTYADMQSLYRLGPDPHDPCDNIRAGTAYLRQMYDRFGYPALFAAYNAGPARYEAYLKGQRLPRETEAYMSKVVRFEPDVSSWRVILVDRAPRPPETSTTGSLFVPLGTPAYQSQSALQVRPEE